MLTREQAQLPDVVFVGREEMQRPFQVPGRRWSWVLRSWCFQICPICCLTVSPAQGFLCDHWNSEFSKGY